MFALFTECIHEPPCHGYTTIQHSFNYFIEYTIRYEALLLEIVMLHCGVAWFATNKRRETKFDFVILLGLQAWGGMGVWAGSYEITLIRVQLACRNKCKLYRS